MSIFKPSQKTFSPLVNDNEQGPSEGGGGGKLITFYWEEDDILLSCKQIFDW